jgi:hypothetical protein
MVTLPFDLSRPVSGEASVELDYSQQQVFDFVGENFFDNYPKWALEVHEFEPLDGDKMFVGAKAKQIRMDNDVLTESIFEVSEYKPDETITIEGLNAPYKQQYLISPALNGQGSFLTFRFELTELEMFMRPFQKLIRFAIEEGADNTVNNIRQLLNAAAI